MSSLRLGYDGRRRWSQPGMQFWQAQRGMINGGQHFHASHAWRTR